MEFSFFKKKNTIKNNPVPPEMYRSVHVMQDDIDKLQGKMPDLSKTSVEETELRPGNPFLTSQGVSEEKEEKPFESGIQEPSFASEVHIKKPEKRLYILFFGAGALILLLIGIGVYFFFFSTSSENVVMKDTSPETFTLPEQTVPEKLAGYYSVENPNYLPIDIESSQGTPEGVRTALADAAMKVRVMNSNEPVEFVVVDKNNFPIAFSRFAYLMNLDLPESIVAMFGEAFSIYMISEGDDVRYGLSVATVDETTLKEQIASMESDLPKLFWPILYDQTVSVPSEVVFRSGSYGELGTRFSLIDPVRGVSFDYVFLKGKLIIGTSKTGFQGILAKLMLSK